MRRVSLSDLVAEVKAEAGVSAHDNSDETIKVKLRRQQEVWWERYEFDPIVVYGEIFLLAGERYYALPAGIPFEGLQEVRYQYGNEYYPLDSDITPDYYTAYDSTIGEQSQLVSAYRQILTGERYVVGVNPGTIAEIQGIRFTSASGNAAVGDCLAFDHNTSVRNTNYFSFTMGCLRLYWGGKPQKPYANATLNDFVAAWGENQSETASAIRGDIVASLADGYDGTELLSAVIGTEAQFEALRPAFAKQSPAIYRQAETGKQPVDDVIEVWPIPSTDSTDTDGKLLVRGERGLFPFQADGDLCTLDGTALVLVVAGEMLARRKQKDGELLIAKGEAKMKDLFQNTKKEDNMNFASMGSWEFIPLSQRISNRTVAIRRG